MPRNGDAPAVERYEIARSAEAIGSRTISQFHPHLVQFRVLYLFSSKVKIVKGQVKAGSARKADARTKFLAIFITERQGDQDAGPHFVIIISKPIWERMEEPERIALIDHELCHCEVGEDKDGNPVPTLVGHDVEEFHAIVLRHGDWTANLKNFAEAHEKGMARLAGL